MEVKPIPKLVWEMSLPPLISMFLQYSYNFIDSAYVAQISQDALTAISLSFPITTFMIASSIGIGVGINVLVAKYLGEKDQLSANTITTLGILVAFIVGLTINIIVLAILPSYFGMYVEDEEILDLAMKYMRVCAFLQVPNMVHIAIQKILQGTGNMIVPMICQSIGAIFNIIMDPIMIFGWWIFPAMGIEGAALSTVLGYTLSMFIIAYFLLFRPQKVQVIIREFKFRWRMVLDIFRIGFPSFLMNVLGAIMTVIANFLLIDYSLAAVAFYGAYFKIQHLIVMTVNGLIQGVLPIMSFNFGSKDYGRLNEAFRFGTVVAFIILTVGGFITFLFPKELLGLFNAQDDLLSIGIPAMRIMAITYGFIGISQMIASYMQSIQKVRGSILINLLRQLLLLIPLMLLLMNGLGLIGIWIAFPLTETLTVLVAILILKKYRISTANEQ